VTDSEQETVHWNLTADRVVTHSDSNMIEAFGNVALREGDDFLKAAEGQCKRKNGARRGGRL
jgi:LPS-assembly protein